MEAPLEYGFGPFTVQPGARQLLVRGQPSKVGARAFDVLLVLIERRDRVVRKDELLDLVWRGVVVEEANLSVHIAALRKVLGPAAIATIPGHGYKFAAEIAGAPAKARIEGSVHEGPQLIGRTEDMSALHALVAANRMVSVIGAGGIGKTRLAAAAANAIREQFSGGVWMVDLAAVAAPDQVAPTTARTLKVTLGPADSALMSIVRVVADQSALLVLDNCEHLLTPVSELVRALLDGGDGVRILVTSQEPLRISGEQVYRLGPLAVPEEIDLGSALSYGAVALFAARARAAEPRFVLNSDVVADVIEICTRLDGIALAIELAAARVPVLGVTGLRAQLAERFNLLTRGERMAMARHQTLRATLEWSYGMLTIEERLLLERLALFAGTFSLTAAQTEAQSQQCDRWVVIEHLASLVDKSMVVTTVDAHGQQRYRLLETHRIYALERVRAAGLLQQEQHRMARTMAEILKDRAPIESPQTWVRRHESDLDSVSAAIAWACGLNGDRELAVELVVESHFIWTSLGQNLEGTRMLAMIQPWMDENLPSLLRAKYLAAICSMHTYTALRDQGEAGVRAAELFGDHGDRDGQFLALTNAARNFALIGDAEATRRALGLARTIVDGTEPPWVQGRIEFVEGQILFFGLGELERARVHFERAHRLNKEKEGDSWFRDSSEAHEVFVDYALRRDEQVVSASTEMLNRQADPLSPYNSGVVGMILGAALTALGHLERADAVFQKAIPEIKRATGTAGWTLNHVVFLVARQGRDTDAARIIGYIDRYGTSQTIARSPGQKRSYEEAERISLGKLGSNEFERARGGGSRLTEDQAIDLALGTSHRERPSQAPAFGQT